MATFGWFRKKNDTTSRSYRLRKAMELHGKAIRYVTERRDDNDDVVGRGGSLHVRGEEFLLFTSEKILLRAHIPEMDISDLLSGDGVILTAPNMEDGGRVHTYTAYYVYYRS